MFTAALVIAAWVAAYFALRTMLKVKQEDLRREFQEQINSLQARVRLLDRMLAQWKDAVPAAANAATLKIGSQSVRRTAPIAWPTTTAASDSDEIPPETMAVIAETVAGLLGENVRVRSVKRLPTAPHQAASEPSATTDPWAQQGRVLVQTSHESVNARTSGTPAPAPASSLRGVSLENTDLS